ncbi:MAG: GH92 family glycosyl hydrolase [Candidatus Eremiobacteraeota bacterium]|nr:GH92 family glycosyl hydrolase [Candidatus Eremiobacteraeota bacterium]
MKIDGITGYGDNYLPGNNIGKKTSTTCPRDSISSSGRSPGWLTNADEIKRKSGIRVANVGKVKTLDEKKTEKPAELVNALMGTDSSYEFSHGGTYPAIAFPFGMTAWTPQTNDSKLLYSYSADHIQGIRGTHSPSMWVGDYGSVTIMPTTGKVEIDPEKRASKFSHDSESAKPYHYSVKMEDYGIKSEVAPSMRCSMMKFTFPDSENANIIIDATPHEGFVKIIPEENKVIGYHNWGGHGKVKDYPGYFCIQFDKPFEKFGTFENGETKEGSTGVEGDNVGGFIRFRTGKNETVRAKVGTSFIDIEQAESNLKQEIPHWDFDKVVDEAKENWNGLLGKIEVEGGTDEQTKTFYGALYRASLFPRELHEKDDEGNSIYKSPYDGKIHKGVMCADTGLWDTYRALFPLYSLMNPDKVSRTINSFLNAYDQSGWMPKWPSPGHRDIMVGTHADSLIADAHCKGVEGFDVGKAYEAMRKNATARGDNEGKVGRLGIGHYKELGYVPCDKVKEATSRTMEFAYDDFCVSQMAKSLGKQGDYNKFKRSSKNYRNVFDPSVGFMRGRLSDGTWRKDFSPFEWGGPFTESSAWQYSWSVQHDMPGLIKLMGGRKKFAKKLDKLFNITPKYEVGEYKKVIHEMREMESAGLGQYAHSNEPVHHVPFLYNQAGQPWKTQEIVRKIMDGQYGSGPDGFVGDEDNGQMSAWYIFNALGFYPTCPGKPIYEIGSPLFKKAKINLPNGKKLVVEAKNNSKENVYVQSVKLNGRELMQPRFEHKDIANGGKLEFVMGSEPNKGWGRTEVG